MTLLLEPVQTRRQHQARRKRGNQNERLSRGLTTRATYKRARRNYRGRAYSGRKTAIIPRRVTFEKVMKCSPRKNEKIRLENGCPKTRTRQCNRPSSTLGRLWGRSKELYFGGRPMSLLGHSRRFDDVYVTSAFPPIAAL